MIGQSPACDAKQLPTHFLKLLDVMFVTRSLVITTCPPISIAFILVLLLA